MRANLAADRRPAGPERFDGGNIRIFVEGGLWVVRTGSPWRDLPGVFDDWNRVFRRLTCWSANKASHHTAKHN